MAIDRYVCVLDFWIFSRRVQHIVSNSSVAVVFNRTHKFISDQRTFLGVAIVHLHTELG